jgi:hypothetical protein
MNVFQIFITDTQYELDPLPVALSSAIDTVKQAFSDCRHKLYRHSEIKLMIKQNFDASVLAAFEGIIPYAYKSDLARYCILYLFGGWYVDIGLRMLSAIRADPQKDLIAFADRGCASCAPWAIQNGLIYSKPQNIVIAKVIEAVCINYRDRFYGQSPLDPTGPNLFGRIIAYHSHEMNTIFGEFRPLTHGLSLSNLMYITDSGRLIAQHKSSWLPGLEGGDFSALGAKGTNNYKQLWNSRAIYQ